MTIPLWCLFVGVVLPYVWAGSSVPHRISQFGSPDLRQPRVQAEQLTGAGARAWGAQMNAWEALIVFAAANMAALATGVDAGGLWSTAAIIWVVARVAHGIFYIRDIAPMRILSFAIGLGMSISIFVLAMID